MVEAVERFNITILPYDLGQLGLLYAAAAMSCLSTQHETFLEFDLELGVLHVLNDVVMIMKTSYVMITKRCIQSRTLQAESALAPKKNLRTQVFFFLPAGLRAKKKPAHAGFFFDFRPGGSAARF